MFYSLLGKYLNSICNFCSHVAGSVFSCRLIIGVGVEVMLRLNGLLDLLYIRVIVPRKQWIDEWKDVIRIGKVLTFDHLLPWSICHL